MKKFDITANLIVTKIKQKKKYGTVTIITNVVLTLTAPKDKDGVTHSDLRRLERLEQAFNAGYTTLRINRDGNVQTTKEF
jgi:hypothetical protein